MVSRPEARPAVIQHEVGVSQGLRVQPCLPQQVSSHPALQQHQKHLLKHTSVEAGRAGFFGEGFEFVAIGSGLHCTALQAALQGSELSSFNTSGELLTERGTHRGCHYGGQKPGPAVIGNSPRGYELSLEKAL